MRRAYDVAGNGQRHMSILTAAESLFRQADGRLPPTAEIAVASGLAKGTLYIYFRIKEEVFAALLLHLWETALAILAEELTRVDQPLPVRIKAFVTRFVTYVDEGPFLLRLDPLSKEVIERSMSVPALIAHKEVSLKTVEDVSAR